MCSDDLFAPAERIDRPQDAQAAGSSAGSCDLVGDRGNLSARLVVQPLPVGAHGDRGERLEGSLPSPLSASSRAIRAKSRIVAEPDHVLSAISRMERGHRVLGSRKPDLLRRSEQTHAVARTAEPRAPGRPRGRAAPRGAACSAVSSAARSKAETATSPAREALPGLLQRRAPRQPPRPARMRPRRGARRHGPAHRPAPRRGQRARSEALQASLPAPPPSGSTGAGTGIAPTRASRGRRRQPAPGRWSRAPHCSTQLVEVDVVERREEQPPHARRAEASSAAT